MTRAIFPATSTVIAALLAVLVAPSLQSRADEPVEKKAEGDAVPGERPTGPADEPASESPAAAAKAIVWHESLEAAFGEARKSSRLVMIDFEAEWCGWCKKLDRETYGAEEVIRFVTNTFESVKVDVDEDTEAMKRFGVSGLPTIVFLSVPAGKTAAESEHQELARIEGFRPPDLFLAEARKATLAGQSLAEIRKAAEENPADADAQRAYARALLVGGQTEDAEKVLRAALERIPGSPVLVFELAEIDRLAGRFEAAVGRYREILAAPSAPAEVTKQVAVPLARCLISLGKPAEAESALDPLLAAIPREVLAAAEAGASDDPRADDATAETPRLDATLLEALFLRGYVRAILERPGEAVADLRIARVADPDGPWGFGASFIIARLRP